MGRAGAFLRMPLAAVRAPRRGTCLWVTFERGGRPLGRISSSTGLVRWGPKPGLEFPYPAQGTDGPEALFRPGLRGPRLLLRDGMEGDLWAGSTQLRLEELALWGLVRGRGRHRSVQLTPEMSGRVRYRGLGVHFEFGPEPAVEARIRPAPTPARFRRGLLTREERPFALLVWGVYGVLLLGSLYLATRPIPKELPPDALSRRFARLIYEAPQAKTRVRQEIIRKREAEQARTEPTMAPEPPRPEPEKPEELKKPEPQPEPKETGTATAPEPPAEAKQPEPPTPVSGSPGPPEPTAAQRAEQIRESVRGKGLLGLLGGRGSASVARTGSSILQAKGSTEDLDQVLDRVEGLRKGPEPASTSGGGGGSGLAGSSGVRPSSRHLDEAAREVAAASPRAPRLEERQDQKVEAKETNEPQESFSLKEATAAINRAVAAYTGGLRYLYNKELRKNPDLEGKLTVSIMISPSGTVAECHVVESTLHAPELEKAVLDRIRKWTFPPVASKPVTVTYPFVFFPTM